MNIQTTLFVQGGLDSLKEKMDKSYSEGKIVSAVASDDGDFMVIFKDKTKNQKISIVPGGFSKLNKEIADMEEELWHVSTIATEDNNFLVVFHKDFSDDFDCQPDDLFGMELMRKYKQESL